MLSFRKIDRTVHHLQRMREIIAVAVRYGFEDVVAETRLKSLISTLRIRISPAVVERSRWERIRMMLEELGPTFVKFGQLLSNRPDVVPLPLVRELEKLQDRVKPFPASEAEAALEKAWGKPWREVLERFDETPVASASMAQVHHAVLRDGHRRVALKIRRPGIAKTVDVDLEILRNFAAWADGRFESFRALHLVPVVEEFDQGLRREIDFRLEGAHLRLFGERYGNEPMLVVPKFHAELSGEGLVVLDFVEGTKISEVERLREAGIDLPRLARTGSDLILRQIFEHGFFHADPHPGNILVLPGGKVCFLDFGAVGILSAEQQECLADFLIAVEERDSHALSRTLQRMSAVEAPDFQRFRDDVQTLLQNLAEIPSSGLDVGQALGSVVRILAKHRVQVHPVYYVLLKALVSLEGISRALDPQYDLVRELEPHVRKLVLLKFRPDRIARGLVRDFGDVSAALRTLPDEALSLVRQTRRGELAVRFEHDGLGGLQRSLRDSADRLSLAIVLAALLISSSLVIHAKLPPLLFGFPVLGVAGFCAAGALVLWLLVTAFFRRGG
ncbi:MAG: AarF/ABC1/UbiB kinase family protein [Fibrobacterales bacterium]|nr:AarF/ABC1/UbiB kinase family protein [Fibrobacterales bacterium]MBP5188461.1 AarF/ABC1/UbiB kinase family protein [Fibrobacterales bacterium]